MKQEITPQFIHENISLLMGYFLDKGSKFLPKKVILTGSTTLNLLGYISRKPNDVDIVIQCEESQAEFVRSLIEQYGQISGTICKKSYNDKENYIFIAIEIKGIQFDFWITSQEVPTLAVSLPNSFIQIAHPEYTWKRKLASCEAGPKYCRKGMADIQEILDNARAKELKLLTYIMSDKLPTIKIII